MALLGTEPPEDLEQIGFRKITNGKAGEGLKTLLQAAKGYESRGYMLEAARIYRYIGMFMLNRTGSLEKSRPPLLKSAYLYIRLISDEIEKEEVNLDRLEDFCMNVLEIFSTLEDTRNLHKYAREFAQMYEDLGDAYYNAEEISTSIRVYEASLRHYRVIKDEEGIRSISEKLVTLYGKMAEERLEKNDHVGAADIFFRVAFFIKDLFGYDLHFMEMMDTAGKNYEKASKLSYAEGDLDRTTELLVKAQYAYLLGRNFSRAKLLGLNVSRMLYQVVTAYKSMGELEVAARKLMELSKALIALGKFENAVDVYKSVLEISTNLEHKVEVRKSILEYLAASKSDAGILGVIESVDFYIRKGKYKEALELIEDTFSRHLDDVAGIRKLLYRAEGFAEE
ncbi:hypothetical protein [Thermococcus sp.]